MAKEYRVFVHFDALDTLPKSGRRRAAVIAHLQMLGQIAHLGGDYEVKDPETGRPFMVTEVAGYAITWWIDAPVGEVKAALNGPGITAHGLSHGNGWNRGVRTLKGCRR